MKLKILSLNLFRYYQDWEKRKSNILKFIKDENPDVIVLQECFDDSRHNEKGNNQGVQLNKELEFKNCIFSVAEELKSEGGKPITVPVSDGLCILTNLEVIDQKDIPLTKAEDDHHTRIIQRVSLKIEGKTITFFHTHFSNKVHWARAHISETIDIAKKENTNPIILGDLNILFPKDLMEFAGEDYEISWFVKKYISFPSKNEVLDYVLIPKKIYQFDDISCKGEGLSDHLALICTISSKNQN